MIVSHYFSIAVILGHNAFFLMELCMYYPPPPRGNNFEFDPVKKVGSRHSFGANFFTFMMNEICTGNVGGTAFCDRTDNEKCPSCLLPFFMKLHVLLFLGGIME